jgi:hypothetical protein
MSNEKRINTSKRSRKETPVLTEALRLLALGYRVLPIDLKNKHPRVKWKQYQTELPTETLVVEWFSKWPDSGLGICTNGLVVVDDDNDTANYEYSKKLRLKSDSHPIVHTPRGGMHHYFREPSDLEVRSSTGKIAASVDIRARGGFLVLPPTTRTDGSSYTWENDQNISCRPQDLPLPPQLILDDIKPSSPDKNTRQAEPLDMSQSVDVNRNVNYAREAGYLRRAGASENVLRAFLFARNDESDDPLETDEIESVAHSIAQYDPDKCLYDFMGEKAPNGPVGLGASQNGTTSPSVRIETLEELESREPPDDLVPGLIPDKSLTVIGGKPAAGKSLFLEALAYSVALKVPLMGTGPIPARSGWVLLLLPEASSSWGARSKRFREHYGIELTDQICAATTGVNFTVPNYIEDICTAINSEISNRGGELPALIILDTLSASIPGADENNQGAMTPVFSALQAWVTKGIPVVVSHHFTKDKSTLRGSTVIEGSIDRSLLIKDLGGVRKVSKGKVRDGVVTPIFYEIIDVDNYPVPVLQTPAAGEFGFHNGSQEMQNLLKSRGYSEGANRCTAPFTGGVSVNILAKEWRRTTPINPSRTKDRKAYDMENNRRKAEILKFVQSLEHTGEIQMLVGSLTEGPRSSRYKATFNQWSVES